VARNEGTAAAAAAPSEGATDEADIAGPLLILGVGILVVLGLIIGMKINAFIALITAAMVVSLLAPGPWAEKISRVAEAFGGAAGKIGIVIALAAVIGKCMLDSGAADRIVRSFLRLFGEQRAPAALMGSGFVLAIPVFFDTVFYLLVPLARSLHRKTGVNYLLYVLAIGAGGAITHTLVPPTPGPLIMAAALDFPIGIMLLVGLCVALPAALVSLIYARIVNRVMDVPMRQIGSEPEPKPLSDDELPSLLLSLLPVILPVILITTNTVLGLWVSSYEAAESAPQWLNGAFDVSAIIGNANFALLLSAVIAILTLYKQRSLSRAELAAAVETSLMSGGVIILITAGGGAFGAMLKEARVGTAIEALFAGIGATGIMILLLGFCLAAVLKIAQGSSTVAMITGSAMLAGIASPATLGFHPVYLATAIGAGSLVGSWMNDSGFWIFAKMSGLTEVEALKSWTTTLLVLALVSLGVTMILAFLLPNPLGFISAQVSSP
jgi:GntP family gluconate:H+ symporter